MRAGRSRASPTAPLRGHEGRHAPRCRPHRRNPCGSAWPPPCSRRPSRPVAGPSATGACCPRSPPPPRRPRSAAPPPLPPPPPPSPSQPPAPPRPPHAPPGTVPPYARRSVPRGRSRADCATGWRHPRGSQALSRGTRPAARPAAV
eukprot:scaffold104556_cov73-Phaeocystis_antarctica.AAC.2